MSHGLSLKILDIPFTVSRLTDGGMPDLTHPYTFFARTEDEISLVCPTAFVPAETERREDGWHAFCVDGILDFFDTNDFDNAVICSLDADTIIGKDYFVNIRKGMTQNKSCGVLTFDVRHQSDAEKHESIAQYENYLHSYRSGLEYANSPYAFFTVGSAFAVRASAYIKAGGMRKLKAGEDFYFLQSAVKSTQVKHYPQVTVHPSARFSPRVPFGTGVALQMICDNEKEFTVFPPEAFEALKKVISEATPENLCDIKKFLSSLPAESADFFIQHGFEENWQKVINNMPRPQLQNAFLLHWFDGLKTLQFIKHISNSYQ